MTTITPYLIGKPWWQSRGVIGAVVVIIAVVLRHLGWNVDQGKLADDISAVLELLGAIVALYGRIKADQPIIWTRGTVPGGAFNPQAEVRRAEAVGKDSGERIQDSEQGAAVLQAICALAACVLIGAIMAACHPTEAINSRQDAKTPRNPEIPRVLHPSLGADLLKSLRVSPGIDIGTNSHGQTIYGPSITLRGGVEF